MRRVRPLALTAAASLLFSLPAFAAEGVSVSAQVDKTEVKQGEMLTFEVTLSGLGQETPKIELGLLQGFKVLSSGQSQQVTVKAGKVNQTMTVTYALLALEAGDRTLGPVHVEVRGKKIETRPVQIKVLPRSALPEPELEGEVVL